MYFKKSSKFEKEFKKLKKKYKSLDYNLENLESVIKIFPRGNGSRHWQVLHKADELVICKVRMHCSYLKKKSFRIIYAYNYKIKVIEFIKFIEIFFEGNKESENRQRINDYLNKRGGGIN